MFSIDVASRPASVALILFASVAGAVQANAESGFPFGMEMTLDALPQPGSKRVPDLDIGDNGEVVLELWCKGGKGQFSVAGNTVIFVAGPMEDRACPPARAQADDELVAGRRGLPLDPRQRSRCCRPPGNGRAMPSPSPARRRSSFTSTRTEAKR